jgi:ABC-type uncharacterized transport system permease subunit
MKKIYKASWILLALAFVATVLTGNFNMLSLVVFSFAALALVYALAIWSVFVNTQSTEPENLRKI